IAPGAPTSALTPTESPTNGYHSAIEARPDVEKWVQVDLGRSVPIETIRLLPARPTDFADTPGFGFPVRFRVAISDEPTLAHAETLADHTQADYPNPGDTPVVLSTGKHTARYIRVTATRLWPRTHDYVFALAEIQVLSGGKNVAQGAAVTARDSIEAGRWSTRFLTDNFDSRQSLTPQALVYAPLPRKPRPIYVLPRGDVEKPGEQVGPGALSCLSGQDSIFTLKDPNDEGQRRAALAHWLTSPANVLTWRSIVNRIWGFHFGRGIVDTPNDFGKNGSRPTHPELLDWLAQDFRDNGQSLKRLHRMLVLSATYRQSSQDNPAYATQDADNRRLWRMNRQRLDAEEVRDTVLAVSGKLDLTMGGPGFELFRFKDDHSPVYDYTAPHVADQPAAWRRAVYAFTVRSVQNPFMECLDCADPNINTPVRNTTLTALQALALLNDPFMLRQAELFAERLKTLSPEPARQIEAAYQLAFGRAPTPDEGAALAVYARKHGLPAACRLLFNANEFVFID
ncbi:MAG TPA: DUF1553 domain-containing protein, partial [Chthonomonadaceae bacterium]|nr:DUF1553 domain-containing protein [Chthonomonadaceae bacterium]